MSLLSTAQINQSDQDLSAFYKSSPASTVDAERASKPLKQKREQRSSVYIPLPGVDDIASELTDEEIQVSFPEQCTFCQSESLFVEFIFDYYF